MFGILHITYLIISTILIVIFLILTFKNKKHINIKKIKFIIGFTLFVLLLINRSSIYLYGNIQHEANNIVYPYRIIPDSWCSANCLMLSIYLMFDIKHNSICFPIWLGFLGGIMGSVAATYLNRQPFFEADSLTGLIYHSIMIFTSIFLFITCEYKPRIFDFLYFTFGMIFLTFIGVIEKYGYNFDHAMQVNESFFSGNNVASIITSNYVIIPAASVLVFVVNFIINRIEKKRGIL